MFQQLIFDAEMAHMGEYCCFVSHAGLLDGHKIKIVTFFLLLRTNICFVFGCPQKLELGHTRSVPGTGETRT